MRNIILIFKNSVMRNLLMIVIAIASLALMINIFSAFSKGGTVFDLDQIEVGIVDFDNSPLSENMKKYLTEKLNMVISEKNDYDSLADLLINRDISAIIEVPQGLYENAAAGTVGELTVTTLDDYENAAFINAYLETYMQSVKALSDGASGKKDTFDKMLSADISGGTVTTVERDSNAMLKTNTLNAFCTSSGFMMMIISGVTVFISYMIIADRNTGTYSRMRCSSLKPVEYVVGVNLFGVICCTAMNVFFVIFTFFGNGNIPLPFGLTLAASELFTIFSVGMSVLFALCIKTTQNLMTVAIGYTTLGSMLGGAWFPIHGDLGIVSNVAKIFPQYWFMDMLRNMPGDPGYDWVPNICILALSAVLVYLVSAVIFTRKNV
ncbi:MAG: ABC transporter permease [Oscillospiraceae bacterium]|nr:ABC transporter permease [Oscillospiraceae bacterium]